MDISDPDFHPGGRQLALPEDEVHLWRIDLAAVAAAEARWRNILSADERTKADRFHFEQDRQSFTSTRALLRTLLGSYMMSDPGELTFLYSEKGKPSLAMSGNSLQFNVSHSSKQAFLAFARGRALGVDVEEIRENFDPAALARRFFSTDEQAELSALAPEEKYRGFFRCWTRKEAYIKATGDGLSLPLDQFDVSLRAADENALRSTRPDATQATLWSLREVSAASGYMAALCVRGQGWRLKI